ncbi:MAG: MG2 domain-containing protein [Polyangiales bacterium]
MGIRGIRAALAAALAAFCLGMGAKAEAQRGGGYELALSGATVVTYGERFRAAGTAYEVEGLATLRPLVGGEVRAELRSYEPQHGVWTTVVSGSFPTDRAGRFLVELDVPLRAMPNVQLHVVVGKRGREDGREFDFGLSARAPYVLDLLTDRQRYEPGETLHAFMRAQELGSRAPVVDRPVHVTVREPSGRLVFDREVRTRASGAISIDAPLPDTATDGSYTVVAELRADVGNVTAMRSVQIGRRTTERLLVTATLEQEVVAPSGLLVGLVRVRTPSGATVSGASVTVATPSGTPQSFSTNDEGLAPFRIQAPAYLAGDLEEQSLTVRVSHPAYGTLHVPVAYTLSRTEVRVEAVAANGGLVPDVPTSVFLHVTDVRGHEVPAGTTIDVEGSGVDGRTQRVATDRHGFAEVRMRIPEGEAGPIEEAGPCTGRIGIRFHATVNARHSYRVELCAPVAREAEVRIHLASPVVAPGGNLDVDVARRGASGNRPVLVEALSAGVPVSAVWIEPGSSRATLRLPEDVQGLLLVRARPFGGAEAARPVSVEGGVAFGTGSIEAAFVRPVDAFALSLRADEEPYPVRGTASVAVGMSRASGGAFATIVARDLAQHGGEVDWVSRWLAAFDAEVTRPDLEDGTLLVRSALAAAVSEDVAVRGVAPLVVPPWDNGDHGEPYPNPGRGELRDPVKLRDELVRRGIGQLMVALEQAVEGTIGGDLEEQRLVQRRGTGRGFHPDAIAWMVEQGNFSEEQVETLGGVPMTLAMLEAADPSFRFDTVATRIARRRLVRLLDALLAFTNPDDPNAQRASAGQPRERWLSRMIQLGILEPEALLDPWGRSFVFRPSPDARLVVSDRAPGWELVSPGPDGRPGTADDVRDPFRRAVAEGTQYAIASGEDDLMRALSTIAPGEGTLQAMLAAYRTMSLAASEEQTGSVVTASASEAYGDAMPSQAMDEESIGYGGLGLVGTGAGGGGVGYGRGSGMMARASAAPMAQIAPAAPPPGEADDRSQQGAPGSTLARVGERIRERFPATLFFAGEIPLDGATTNVPIALADALTTYRVEAIAWTVSGWTTSARTELRVDQEATVDAPIPPFATLGDVLRIPVRVQNRTRTPMQVTIGMASEGVGIDAGTTRTLEVPPRDAVESIVEVRVTAVGEGAIVVRAVRASGGEPLDAVRRPLHVFEDARLVRETRRFLAEGSAELELEVPSDATPRGPAALRLATGMEFFGELPRGNLFEKTRAAWAEAYAGLPVDEATRAAIASALRYRGDGNWDEIPLPEARGMASIVWGGNLVELARLVGVGWGSPEVQDADLARALELLSRTLPERGERPSPDAGTAIQDSRVLLLLAPAMRGEGRSAIVADRDRLVARFRSVVGSAAARLSDSDTVAVNAAAALAATSGGDGDRRAREMIRRLERSLIRVDDATFLEVPEQYGVPHAREVPTSLLALAYLGLGDREAAFACLRGLARRPERTLAAGSDAIFLAAAAVGSLVPRDPGAIRLSVDGHPIETTREAGLVRASIEGLDRPGRHRLSVGLAERALAWIELDLRYGRPWSAPESLPLRVDVALEGETGGRDTRAGLVLAIRNRTPRRMRSPIVEIDLPAGTELDEPTRAALAALTASQPTMEGRTLSLHLRPLAPGAFVRLPLPLRWSVSGTLRGLGAVVYDDDEAGTTRPRVAILASRAIELVDRGAEPEAPEPEESPPPPEPRPLPIPVIRPLSPALEVRP